MYVQLTVEHQSLPKEGEIAHIDKPTDKSRVTRPELERGRHNKKYLTLGTETLHAITVDDSTKHQYVSIRIASATIARRKGT